MDSLDQVSAHACPPNFKTVSDEPRQQFNRLRLRGSQCDDAVLCQVSRVIESSGVAEIMRRKKLGWKSQALAVTENVSGSGLSGRVLCLLIITYLVAINSN